MTEEAAGRYPDDLPPLRKDPLSDAEPVDLDKFVPPHGEPLLEDRVAAGGGTADAPTQLADALPPDDSEAAPGNDPVEDSPTG